MTQQLTSPSNSSIDQNVFRLNSSSCCLVSPSQSNFGSHLKDNLVQFEQYKCENKILPLPENNIKKPSAVGIGGLGKKKLTIQIDESYDISNNNQDTQKFDKLERMDKIDKVEKAKPKLSHGLELQQYSFESESRQMDGLELISPIENKNMVKILELQQRVKQLEQKEQLLLQIAAEKDNKIKLFKETVQQFRNQIEKKECDIKFRDTRIQYMEQKVKQKQAEVDKLKEEIKNNYEKQISNSLLGQIEQKMKEKDNKIRELMKINEKLKTLNKDIIRELKVSQKKVRDLEKQIQNNLCTVTQQNIHRMKQSSLKMKQKQNYERYNGLSHTHHTKTERDSLQTHQNLNTTKQKQLSFAGTGTSGPRKSLQRKKTTNNNNSTSAGQLSHPKKSGNIKIGCSASSNTILSKKLMHK